jgi:hypothetical protein
MWFIFNNINLFMKNIVVILFLASFLQGCEKNPITESIKTPGGLVQCDSPCTEAAIPKKIDFAYTSTIKGDIIFRFLKKDNSYIEHKLRVE